MEPVFPLAIQFGEMLVKQPLYLHTPYMLSNFAFPSGTFACFFNKVLGWDPATHELDARKARNREETQYKEQLPAMV